MALCTILSPQLLHTALMLSTWVGQMEHTDLRLETVFSDVKNAISLKTSA